jgi:hypothetical protein
MRNKILTSIAAAASLVALAVSPALAWQSGGGQGGGNEDKVTLCHATDSNTNPYVRITVAAAGAYHGHYTEHQGPVYPGSGGKWGDIIPPFAYQDHSYSLNWDSNGQAIYNNNCNPVGGTGGGDQKDCDNDFDNSPSTDSECATQPQKDCDNDFDSSPASECPSTGGLGGGGGDGTTTTTTATTTTPSATTAVTGGRGGGEAAQVTAPTGGVGAGEGGAATGTSIASLFGLVGSLSAAGYGMRRLGRQQG